MQIVALADEQLKEGLFSEISAADIEIVWVNSSKEALEHKNAIACFDLRETEPKEWEVYRSFATVPVFVHAITYTLNDLRALSHLVRINAWPGFMKRSLVEACAKETIRGEAARILEKLGKRVQWVPDIPGLVAPRILAMIINEAYFALGEGVSSKEEIDTAMKLGTNYPLGPFEWAATIGIERIYRLLEKLGGPGSRYAIAPALASEWRLSV